MLVAASPQTIKQHLAAIKMLFDYPVLSVEDARTLLDSIPCRVCGTGP